MTNHIYRGDTQMKDIMDNEFAWDLFESTGNIECYLLYNEYNKISMRKESDEYHTDESTCFKNL